MRSLLAARLPDVLPILIALIALAVAACGPGGGSNGGY
jgi:hypothetical protein